MKKILAILCILCMMLSLFSCQTEDVKLDKEKSCFSDFKIENDKVYIYCTLYIDNKSDTEKVISLTASFEEDVENGLLKEYTFFNLVKNVCSIFVCFLGY